MCKYEEKIDDEIYEYVHRREYPEEVAEMIAVDLILGGRPANLLDLSLYAWARGISDIPLRNAADNI